MIKTRQIRPLSLNKDKKHTGIAIGLFLCLWLITGCSSQENQATDVNSEMVEQMPSTYGNSNTSGSSQSQYFATSPEAGPVAKESGQNQTDAQPESLPPGYNMGNIIAGAREEKIIKKMNIEASTSSMDNVIDSMEIFLESIDGYVENRQVRRPNRNVKGNAGNASFVLRMPKDRYDDMYDWLDREMVIHTLENLTQNVSNMYYDQERDIDALIRRENRLMGRLDDVSSIEDLVAIEEQLRVVREEIELGEGILRNIDDRSDYSTINLVLVEVLDETIIISHRDDFSEQLAKRFKASLLSIKNTFQSFLVFMAGAIVPLFIIASSVFIFRLIYKKRGKHKLSNRSKE